MTKSHGLFKLANGRTIQIASADNLPLRREDVDQLVTAVQHTSSDPAGASIQPAAAASATAQPGDQPTLETLLALIDLRQRCSIAGIEIRSGALASLSRDIEQWITSRLSAQPDTKADDKASPGTTTIEGGRIPDRFLVKSDPAANALHALRRYLDEGSVPTPTLLLVTRLMEGLQQEIGRKNADAASAAIRDALTSASSVKRTIAMANKLAPASTTSEGTGLALSTVRAREALKSLNELVQLDRSIFTADGDLEALSFVLHKLATVAYPTPLPIKGDKPSETAESDDVRAAPLSGEAKPSPSFHGLRTARADGIPAVNTLLQQRGIQGIAQLADTDIHDKLMGGAGDQASDMAYATGVSNFGNHGAVRLKDFVPAVSELASAPAPSGGGNTVNITIGGAGRGTT